MSSELTDGLIHHKHRPRSGIVAFSFGQRSDDEEPNPCNIKLAEQVQDQVIKNEGAVVVAQWEVAKALRIMGVAVHEVGRSTGGRYVDSEQVWTEAERYLSRHGVTDIIAIAQPFLHLREIRRLIRSSGYRRVKSPVRWIGFDNSPLNTQWHTKGPVRLLIYALLRSLPSVRRGAGSSSRIVLL